MKGHDPRSLALQTMMRIEEGGFADLVLDSILQRHPDLDPRDRGLTTELVYGGLRHRGRLDFALAHCCRQPLGQVEPRVLQLLRLGAQQILHLDRIPDHAAVSETVELAKREGLGRATGFINGILRCLTREKDRLPWPDPGQRPSEYLQHVGSLPDWLAGRWLHELGGTEAAALAAAMLEQPPFTLRVNTLKGDREDFLAALVRDGHRGEPCRFAPEGVRIVARGEKPLPGDAAGLYQVQDEASMLIARLLDPQPQERILDACAAPGGKTTHVAALTGNTGRILALDLHPRRLTLVRQGARRLGCEGIEMRPWDLSHPPDFLDPGSFERILLDAPCSGLGVLRRNPEVRWRRTEAEIEELARLQQTLLAQVAPLLRPGGVLLYSVCTLTPEESEGVVQAFLAAQPQFRREDLRPTVPAHWQELFDAQGALRTYPHRHDGMDAFYAVRLRRR